MSGRTSKRARARDRRPFRAVRIDTNDINFGRYRLHRLAWALVSIISFLSFFSSIFLLILWFNWVQHKWNFYLLRRCKLYSHFISNGSYKMRVNCSCTRDIVFIWFFLSFGRFDLLKYFSAYSPAATATVAVALLNDMSFYFFYFLWYIN